MAPFAARTYYAATGQTLPQQHRNLFNAVTPDIAALAEIEQTLPSQLHIINDLGMIDAAALAETGQTIPPQRYNLNDAAVTDVVVVAENAGCVGRVCLRASISQAPSAQATSDSGQSHSS